MGYWCFDPLWKAEDTYLGELAKEELGKIMLVPSYIPIRDTYAVRLPCCYPVYQTGYKKNLSGIQVYLDTLANLIPIGRYGVIKYNDQDHSILMGILARQILTGKREDTYGLSAQIPSTRRN
ncbi:MAG: hypothetical protein ACUVRD_05360 [Bacteroidia bacterium]